MLNAFALSGWALDGHARAGRGEDIEAVGGAYLVYPEEVGGSADNDDAVKVVGTSEDSEPVYRLIGTGAFGFGDDV